MITRRTVIVLGAGASFPYGLPLGAGLRDKILALGADDLARLPVGAGQQRPPHIPHLFQPAFRRSQAYSIDAFLARRPEFVDIGRHAIASCLLPCESLKLLVDSDPDDHWYRYLAHAMDATWDDYPQNQVAFVTFNYDRSLEIFLITMLQHRYGKSEADCLQMLENFPIVHVYGSLGSIDPDHKQFVPYGAGGEVQRYLGMAASGLRIIAEGRDDSEEFRHAKQLISEAEALCFLGFGFDEMNVQRLGGTAVSAGWRMIGVGAGRSIPFAGTAYGMTSAEVQDVAQRIAVGHGQEVVERNLLNLQSLRLLRATQILR